MHFRILFRLIPVLVAIGATQFSLAPFSSRELGYIQRRLQTGWNITLLKRIVSSVDGAVYEAKQESDLLAVQLSSSKRYQDQESWFNLRASEWECMRLTAHPNLPLAYDHATFSLGKTDAVRVTFSELLGPNLKQMQKLSPTFANSGLPVSVVIRIAQDVSSALVHLHSLFVAHHNVKLENIVMIGGPNLHRDMTRQLAQAHYKLIGLGFCQDYANRTSMESVYHAGDRQYASPEKLDSTKPYDAFLADAYAFGATLARALMGESTRLAIIEKIRRDPTIQLAVNPIGTVYRLYRKDWLPEGLDEQDDFYNLVGLLLEPLASNRMPIDKFLFNLVQKDV